MIITELVLEAVVVAVASSPPTWLETTWASPPACVDAPTLGERTEALLGADRVPPPTRARLAAAQRDGQWTIAIDLQSADVTTHRELQGDDCEVLTEAVALVIAVQVDPVAVAVAVEPVAVEPIAAPSVGPTIPAPADPVEPAPSVHTETSRPPPRIRSRPRAIVGAAVAGEIGLLPRGAATLELDVGVTWRHARIEVAGLTSLGPDAREVDGVTARFRLFAAVVRGCGVLVRDDIEFPLCGAVEAGGIWAKASGLQNAPTVLTPWVAPVLGLRPRWVVSRRVALGLHIDVVVPILQHRFAPSDADFVHEVWPVVGRAGLGVDVRLP